MIPEGWHGHAADPIEVVTHKCADCGRVVTRLTDGSFVHLARTDPYNRNNDDGVKFYRAQEAAAKAAHLADATAAGASSPAAVPSLHQARQFEGGVSCACGKAFGHSMTTTGRGPESGWHPRRNASARDDSPANAGMRSAPAMLASPDSYQWDRQEVGGPVTKFAALDAER